MNSNMPAEVPHLPSGLFVAVTRGLVGGELTDAQREMVSRFEADHPEELADITAVCRTATAMLSPRGAKAGPDRVEEAEAPAWRPPSCLHEEDADL